MAPCCSFFLLFPVELTTGAPAAMQCRLVPNKQLSHCVYVRCQPVRVQVGFKLPASAGSPMANLNGVALMVQLIVRNVRTCYTEAQRVISE